VKLLLEHNYVWEEQSDFLEPTADDTGEVTLYEYWGLDSRRHPLRLLLVNGCRTHFKTWVGDTEELADAVIDLRKEFGLRSSRSCTAGACTGRPTTSP
jgi:hypothetical protein